ncbi:MAG: 30S ribosome-binding factor RbfA [Anaerolineae bacterium]
MTSYRQQRISELLHQELSLLISAELTDPRLADALVTVTHVTVSPDLHNARVFVDHALPAEANHQVLAALRHAEGFLRHALAENLNLRVVPELSFAIDEVERRARRVDQLLDALAGTRPAAAPQVEAHEHVD